MGHMKQISRLLDSVFKAFTIVFSFTGAVAQLGERCVRNAEVGSSTLLRSTL